MTSVAYAIAHPASRGVLGRSYSPAAVAYFGRAPSLPAAWKDVYAAFIDGLVVDGVWPQLDALHVLAGPEQTTANVNLVQAAYGVTAVNAPAWTRKSGYTGGTTKYLSTGFTPSTAGGKWSLNSACLFGWSPVDVNADNNLIRTNGLTAAYAGINLDRTSGQLWSDLNTTTSPNVPITDASGFWLSNRTDASLVRLLKNGGLLASSAGASVALPANPVVVLGWQSLGRYTAIQASITGWGAGLTPAQEAALYSRCSTLLTAIAGLP